jgi:hypothetical protein
MIRMDDKRKPQPRRGIPGAVTVTPSVAITTTKIAEGI